MSEEGSVTTGVKRKRNLPGMPDPEAEVVALSPKTLMATNRFVCEICSKGFQRDQNLQLHRRGHNLPWKLKQRVPGVEPRKRVFVCPEEGCVHHDPKRALGDLTGIKKHYCRKHGEKKWKCDRCAKNYAVQSDWKAHMKTCGTREYRCDCGTMFSRRDSFITHRAFCDTLAQESIRAQTLDASINLEGSQSALIAGPSSSSSPPPPPLTPSTAVLSPVLSIQSSEVPEQGTGPIQTPALVLGNIPNTTIVSGSVTSSTNNNNNNSSMFSTMFTSTPPLPDPSQPSQSPSSFTDMLCSIPNECNLLEPPMSLSLSSSLYLSSPSSLYPSTTSLYASRPPALSATALLQKAAQMGATGSSSSFLRGLGLDMSLSSPAYQSQNNNTLGNASVHVKPTLDFLGLGIGSGSDSNAGFSALMDSFSSGLDATTYGGNVDSNEDQQWKDQNPSLL